MKMKKSDKEEAEERCSKGRGRIKEISDAEWAKHDEEDEENEEDGNGWKMDDDSGEQGKEAGADEDDDGSTARCTSSSRFHA